MSSIAGVSFSGVEFGMCMKPEQHIKDTEEHHPREKLHPASSPGVEEGPLMKEQRYFKSSASQFFLLLHPQTAGGYEVKLGMPNQE